MTYYTDDIQDYLGRAQVDGKFTESFCFLWLAIFDWTYTLLQLYRYKDFRQVDIDKSHFGEFIYSTNITYGRSVEDGYRMVVHAMSEQDAVKRINEKLDEKFPERKHKVTGFSTN